MFQVRNIPLRAPDALQHPVLDDSPSASQKVSSISRIVHRCGFDGSELVSGADEGSEGLGGLLDTLIRLWRKQFADLRADNLFRPLEADQPRQGVVAFGHVAVLKNSLEL